MAGQEVKSIGYQLFSLPRIVLKKDAMCLKGNGCGTMCHILFIQKRAAPFWLNRWLATGMGDLIPSTRIGGGSLMDAISQGKTLFVYHLFFVWSTYLTFGSKDQGWSLLYKAIEAPCKMLAKQNVKMLFHVTFKCIFFIAVWKWIPKYKWNECHFCFKQSFTLLPVTVQNSLNQLSKLHDYYVGYVITTTLWILIVIWVVIKWVWEKFCLFFY